MNTKLKQLALNSMLLVVALILSYVESLVPLSLGIPGIKMGLPNLVVLFALYQLGWKNACVISLVRLVMILLKKCGKFGTAGVSVAGGVAHNAGQILVAMALLETAEISYYLPVLCVSGTVAGICIGLAASLLIRRIPEKNL